MPSDVKEKYKQYLNTPEGARLYNEFKLILYGQSDSLVTFIFECLQQEISNRKTLKILDIGGGDGRRLIRLIELLREVGVNATATLVEPSQAFITNLLNQLKEHPYPIQIVHSIFEEYVPEESFDVVLLIHAIYTFRDATYINRIKQSLNKNGTVLIASNQPNSLLAQLKAVLDQNHNSTRKEIEEVLAEIKQAGFTLATHTSTTYFARCVEHDHLTQRGKDIVEWLSLRPYNEICQADIASATNIFIQNLHGGKNSESEIVIIAHL